MTDRHLPQLDGTNYVAEVYRHENADLSVRVSRPSRQMTSEPMMELVGDRYLGKTPTAEDRDRVIAEIIKTDTADIVGVYTGEKENA